MWRKGGAERTRVIFRQVLSLSLPLFAGGCGSSSELPEDPCGQEGACEGTSPSDDHDDADAGAPSIAPVPGCADVDKRLLDDFGIIMQPGTLAFGGLASENVDCQGRIKVYEMFTHPFAYAGYTRHLDPTKPFTMHLYQTAKPVSGSCSAYVPSAKAMQVRDLKACLKAVTDASGTSFRRVATFLLHESGHVIADRNAKMKPAFDAAGLPALDPTCFDRGFVKTYSLRTTNPVSESFAESTALFIWKKKKGTLGTINDFKTECPNTYDWIKKAVYDG